LIFYPSRSRIRNTDILLLSLKGVILHLLFIYRRSFLVICRKCGSDALQYIKFQRHLTIFILIITVVCMAIILPINFTMGSIQVFAV
jgi:hypothetical protein